MAFAVYLLLRVLLGPFAGVATFDGTALPEDVGWVRSAFGNTNRLTNDGIFIQQFSVSGDSDVYRRSISEFSGASTFFAEWRMQTNAPAYLLDTLQVPASFVLGNNGGSYHFRFTDTEALFTRSDLSLFYYSIEPDTMHTYRIELLEDNTYRFLIDAIMVDSGNQLSPYPTNNSRLVWGGSFFAPSQTIQWDYIRYGTIPEPATGLLLLAGMCGIIGLRMRRPAC